MGSADVGVSSGATTAPRPDSTHGCGSDTRLGSAEPNRHQQADRRICQWPRDRRGHHQWRSQPLSGSLLKGLSRIRDASTSF